MSLAADVNLDAFIEAKDDLSGADIRVELVLNFDVVNLYGSWNDGVEGASDEGEYGGFRGGEEKDAVSEEIEGTRRSLLVWCLFEN